MVQPCRAFMTPRGRVSANHWAYPTELCPRGLWGLTSTPSQAAASKASSLQLQHDHLQQGSVSSGPKGPWELSLSTLKPLPTSAGILLSARLPSFFLDYRDHPASPLLQKNLQTQTF